MLLGNGMDWQSQDGQMCLFKLINSKIVILTSNNDTVTLIIIITVLVMHHESGNNEGGTREEEASGQEIFCMTLMVINENRNIIVANITTIAIVIQLAPTVSREWRKFE